MDDIRTSLATACQTLSNLNLYQAAKWCAEALNGLEDSATPRTKYVLQPTMTDMDEIMDQDRFLLAKAYFNCKEFDRAAYVLKDCRSANALFLRLYAMLISADKRSVEETDGSIKVGTSTSLLTKVHYEKGEEEHHSNGNGNSEISNFLNSKLSKILQEVSNYNSKPNTAPNAFLYYLNGIIYNKKKKYDLAQQNLYQSLCIFPYNWSCWQELMSSFITYEEVVMFISKLKKSKSTLAQNFMFKFFEVVILQEFYQQLNSLIENLHVLQSQFPKFQFLNVQEFLIAYHGLDYFQAELIFDKILVNDPLRLDDLDTYSNMLYVMEKRSKLSFLAQFLSLIDKFRPETCCIIANYHSMKCEHEKAITYYKRALTLNKNCLSAWTLMGHEFVELKNSHAAIESYRRAVDTNPKDFRAWYGLGQAYEVLDMHMYSLYYYQRATNLQPLDKRMWQALGNCYEKIDKLDESIKSFEKALQIDIQNNTDANQLSGGAGGVSSNPNEEALSNAPILAEPHISYKLATISEKLGRFKDTIKYMKKCLELEPEWGICDETSKARLWLARNALENKRFEEAYILSKDLNHSNAHDIEEARSIAREARNRMLR